MYPFSVTDVPLAGPSLVEASAGTGKTYAISTLFVRLLLEHQLSVRQILVVTFTEAATAELKQRIRVRLRDAIATCDAISKGERVADESLRILVANQPIPELAKATLESALLNFDDASIFTIHGFCHRVLRENAFLSGASFDSELLRDTRPLVDEILGDFWASHLVESPQLLIEHLRKSKLSPLHVATRSFANSIAQRPDLRVLPNRLQQPRPIDSDAFVRAHLELKQLFKADEIRELLLNSKLDKSRYNRRFVPGWCEKMDDYLSNAPSRDLPDCLFRFSTRTLRENAKPESPEHPAFNACDRLLQANEEATEALLEHQIWTSRTLLEFVQTEVGLRKRARNNLSFDDLLQQLELALDTSGHALRSIIRTRYPAALLDEFQDTDPIQLSIFQKIYGRSDSCVFLIGDPKQAIYSFRGADLHAYLLAANGVPTERRYTMGTNYRSDAPLVRAVNGLFAGGLRPFLFTNLDYPMVRPRSETQSALVVDPKLNDAALLFRFFDTNSVAERPDAKQLSNDSLPSHVATEICRTLMSNSTLFGKPISPKDFAVLTRTNKEAFECQAALAALRVPSVVLGDRSVYEYREAAELQLILSAILEPSDSTQLRIALTTELLGYGASDLLALEANDEAWNQWIERFRSLNSRWINDSFVQMIRQLMAEAEIPERLLRLPDGERRMTNLLHLIELIHTEATENHLGPSGIYAFLSEQRTREFAQSDSEQIRLESDEDAVVLTTIHKSKGLEYPIVICPFLASANLEHSSDSLSVRFHDDDGNTCIDLGSDDQKKNIERMRAEVFAENLRLLYVALTRAQHRCIVFWGRFRRFENSALGYLLHRHDLAPTSEQTSADIVAAHSARMKELTDIELLDTIRRVTEDQSGTLVTPPIAPEPGEQFTRAAASAPTLTAKAPRRTAQPWLRTASFSELTAGAHASVAASVDARDLDVEAAPVSMLTANASGPEVPRSSRRPTTLAEFPGGAGTGNFFHTLLEHLDFEQPVDSALVQRTLETHGLPAELEALAVTSLTEVLNTPLAPGLRLVDVSQPRRLDELEFLLPVRNSTTDGRDTPYGERVDLSAVTRDQLARVFEDHPSFALPSDYGQRVRELQFLPLKGFLKGFMDLVFLHDKRWYLVDYKTNRLGDNYSDYDRDSIAANMSESHYCLQYHLYALALDRYLRYRVKGYEYETHFGGVYYLYLRGMHPEFESQLGIYHERPPYERLLALSDCFGVNQVVLS